MNRLGHISLVVAALLLCLGVPTLLYVDVDALLPSDPDAVTAASEDLPGQPAGEFYVLLNKADHPDTLDQWSTFFSGQDAGVIMSDVQCAVAAGDAGGLRLAQWYQARLPENQMTVKAVNGLLLASKTEYRLFDAVVLSREMAEAYGLKSVFHDDGVLCVAVGGK